MYLSSSCHAESLRFCFGTAVAPLQGRFLSHQDARRRHRKLASGFVRWAEWVWIRSQREKRLLKYRAVNGHRRRFQLGRTFHAWEIAAIELFAERTEAGLSEDIVQLKQKNVDGAERMRGLARDRLKRSRWCTKVPDAFKSWAVWARQKGNYKVFVNGTLLRYALRGRAKCFAQWVSFTVKIEASRLELEGKLSASEASGRKSGTASFTRWWEQRAGAITKRVKTQLVDLVTEAHAYRQALEVNGTWDMPITPLRNLHGHWELVAQPEEADDGGTGQLELKSGRAKVAALATDQQKTGDELRHALRKSYTSQRLEVSTSDGSLALSPAASSPMGGGVSGRGGAHGGRRSHGGVGVAGTPKKSAGTPMKRGTDSAEGDAVVRIAFRVWIG